MNDKIKALVLSISDYKENDSLLQVISEDKGFLSLVVKGSKKIYTDIVTDRKYIRYPDSRILIEGDIRSIVHTESDIGK